MYDFAWQTYGDPSFTPRLEHTPELMLRAMRFTFPTLVDTETSRVKGETCSIDNVLSDEINRAAERFNAQSAVISRALPQIQALKAKYGVAQDAQLDTSKMKQADVRQYQQLMNQLLPSYRECDLMLDLQHALEWWEAARMVYSSRREDIRIYGGNVEDIGKTLQARLEKAPQRKKMYVGFWNSINDKVLSEAAKENELIAKVADKAERNAYLLGADGIVIGTNDEVVGAIGWAVLGKRRKCARADLDNIVDRDDVASARSNRSRTGEPASPTPWRASARNLATFLRHRQGLLEHSPNPYPLHSCKHIPQRIDLTYSACRDGARGSGARSR